MKSLAQDDITSKQQGQDSNQEAAPPCLSENKDVASVGGVRPRRQEKRVLTREKEVGWACQAEGLLALGARIRREDEHVCTDMARERPPA